MTRKQKGTFKVGLNSDTGSYVAGDFFVGLADAPGRAWFSVSREQSFRSKAAIYRRTATLRCIHLRFRIQSYALHRSEMLRLRT
jgi:hypothetical protein